jgi:hypothetical protein
MKDKEIDRLKSRLQWEAGPPADLSNRGLDALIASCGALAARLRHTTEDRPLVSLLIAFQLGFAAGKWGPRRAQH